jgi:tetratricopeptide (TPR) repeat protein
MARPNDAEASRLAAPIRHRRLWQYAAPFFLVLLIAWAYSSTLEAGFVVWDDDDHVYENPNITAVDGYRKAWADWRDTAFYPLTFTTFFVEWRLAGGEPWLFHLDNVILHSANAVGAGLLGRAVGLAPGVAWAAAGLWALHPVEVASVAWITERKNVLYVFFYLVALLAYARALDASPRAGLGWRMLSLLCCLASLLSKATAVTLPVAVVLVHWARDRPIGWQFARRVSPYFALALGVGLLHVWREEVTAPTLGLGTRTLVAARAMWFYVGTFLWPVDLVAMYPRWSTDDVLSWGVPSLAALAALLALGAWRFRDIPRPAWFAVAHFAVNIALVVGVIWFPYMRHSFVADHLVYLPSLGLAILVAMAGRAIVGTIGAPGGLRVALGAGAWLLLAGLTSDQALHWQNTIQLWTRTLEVNPDSTTAHNNLGVALIEEERRDEARAHFEAALQVDPDDGTALLNLGVLAAGRKEWLEALTFYKKALRQNYENPFIWNNLGVAASELGKHDRAVEFYHQALQHDPDDATAYTNLGAALSRQGKHEEAIRNHRSALRLNPRFMKAHYNLGNDLAELGRYDEALVHFETANGLAPGDVEILLPLASALSETGDFKGARARLEEAVAIMPTHPTVHYDLGIVLSELGETRQAVEHLERSIEAGAGEAAGALHTVIGTLLDEIEEYERAIGHYRKAIELSPDEPDAYYNLGIALSATGRRNEALEAYRKVLALDPEHAEALNNLGAGLFAEGKTAAAVPYFERAVRAKPNDPDARHNLASALYAGGRGAEALRVLEAALGDGTATPSMRNLTAWVRATSPDAALRDGVGAVRWAESACALTDYANPQYLDTLAAAYAEAGRFADAGRVARQAIELAGSDEKTAAALRSRLALYEAERPYRE